MVKFVDKSIRNRLLGLTRKENLNYQQILIRFIHERFLYRVSISKYATSLYLKGGALLFAYEKFGSRPTVDIDFLGTRIKSDKTEVKKVFTNICSQVCQEDGITFDIQSITTEDIMVNKEYKGVRVQFLAHLDTIVQRISIDLGFGDVITPEPVKITYPALLPNIPETNLFAYSLETVLAEKFHAMVVLENANSRMKDFFDSYQILSNQKIDSTTLKQAIINTFDNRQTTVPQDIIAFTDDFANDPIRNRFWKGFLRRIKWNKPLEFPVVVQLIREKMQPVVSEISRRTTS